MAVKASATVTLSSVVDVKSVWRYYILQASTLSKPSKPTTNPPSGWTTTEPSYTYGSTDSLYFCDLTVFSDNTFVYSDVSLSSSYEAAKAAYNKAKAAKDAADEAQKQLDNKGLRETIIDLLDTEIYDTDMYYPVVGTGIPNNGYHVFEINNQLRSNSAPSWSTHTSTKGFTCNLSARMIGNGWGIVNSNYGWIDNASYYWCDKMPAYIQQMEHSSYPVFYLRGGGKYYAYTDYDCEWSIKTDTYTKNNESVAPTETPSNYSKLVNNWDVVTRVTNAETSITNNETEINLRAKKTEVTEAIDNIQVGGRNLLVGTSNSVTHTGTGSTNQGSALYEMSSYYKSITKLQGHQLTLSFDWETTATSGKFIVTLNDSPWSDLSEWITPSSSNQNGTSVYTAICYANFDTGTYTGIKIRSDNLTGTVTIKNAMLELGNKAGSWQPAPEDVDENATTKANDALKIANTYTDSQIKVTSESITSTVSETYATQASLNTTNSNVTKAQSTANEAKTAASNAQSTANTAKTNAATAQSTADSIEKNLADNYSTTAQIADIYTTQTEMTQTSEEIRMDFTKTISSASNALQSQMEANDTATNQKLSEINKYIRFIDGKIVLGETGNQLVLTIQNNRVSFTQSGVEVAYFSDNNLFVNRATIVTSMKIGNYEFTPRTDGGLALRKTKKSEQGSE